MPKIKSLAFCTLCFAATTDVVFLQASQPGFPKGPDRDPPQVWDAFGGNQQAQKYSTATQITPDNVKTLQKGVGASHRRCVQRRAHETTWGATPLFVNNTVYVGTPKIRIFAVEPDTGKQKWIYAANGAAGKPENQGLKNRGVAYWAASSAGGRPALPEDGLYRHHDRRTAWRGCRYRQAVRRLRQEWRGRRRCLEHHQPQMEDRV